MDEPSQVPLCDVCHSRPGICRLMSITNGVKTTMDVCPDCMESVAPDTAAFLQNKKPCEHCGASATSGSTDTLAMLCGESRTVFRCASCSIELLGFAQRALEEAPEGDSQEKQMEFIREVRERTERHMKEWVRRHRGRLN